jgi:hypothetical protein
MKYSMLIKCDKCGYENFPQHRFCGMCAAELTIPQAPSAGSVRAPQPAVVPRPASRPAAVKVTQEPVAARSVSYLLEDEPAPGHTGRYVWLLVLLVAGAAVVWHWREDLSVIVARISSSSGSSAQSSSSPPASASSDSDTAPATPVGASPAAEKPGVATDTQSIPAQQAAPPTLSGTGDSAQSQHDQSAPSRPGESQPGAAAAPAASSSAVQVRSARMFGPNAEDLEADGEKYLYGSGVPENCGRARKSLLTAAGHANPKAQNVLGTMYATGHCATRDLPTAYRWFGRSLRQDPGNTRIEQDLKVLWNQMTPEERQVALRNNP